MLLPPIKIRMIHSLDHSANHHGSVKFKRIIQLLPPMPPLARVKLNHFFRTSLYQPAVGVFSRSLQPRLADDFFVGE
jgi:hypothetical protein